ncbi:MAG: alpha-2-macroglobulin family protein [Bacteroidales bacterium]|nr:alpha-2-macroglobulin family protein [Bacteroidales bacterium]
MFKRLIWLILFIPLPMAGQDTDHPATSLTRMGEAFRVEASKPDYQKMIWLMDSMMTMETAIDRKARPRLVNTYARYASLFGKSPEGQLVHHLYMHTRFPESRDIYGMILPVSGHDLSTTPATPYQAFFLDQAIVYPCRDLYELALFVLKNYDALIPFLESGRGNLPHNLIAARFLRTVSKPLQPEVTMAGLDSLILQFPGTEPIPFVYLEKVHLLTEKEQYSQALQLSRQIIREFPKSQVRQSLEEQVDFLTEPSLVIRMKKQVYPHAPMQVMITRRNVSGYKLEIRNEQGKRIPGIRKSGMEAPVYEAITDTLTLLQAPAAGYYRVRVKKGRTKSETNFYSGTVAAMFRSLRNTGYVYAADLSTGEPLKKAEVRFVKDARPSFLTDMDGFTPVDVRAGESFRLSPPTPLEAVPDTFAVPLTVHPWDFNYGSPSDKATSAAIFTDRKLYRTQDTLFFKGIVTRYSNKKCEPEKGKNYTVVLRNNASYRDTLYTVDVVTNQYGSFSGFIPPGIVRLNGEHSITIPGASALIRIEEYTRPSFSVDLQPVKQAYAYGDTIIQEGVVNNYAGFPLPGVAVICRVYRQPMFRPYYSDRQIFPAEEQPFWADTLYTGSDGRFRAAFSAAKNGEDHPRGTVLHVHFSAVDPSGETWQQQTFLPVSDYRYTIHSRLGAGKGITDRILVREYGPALALNVRNSMGYNQEVSGSYSLSRNNVIRYSGTFTGKETSQPPWSGMESGQWELSCHLEGAPLHKETFFLVSLQDSISPADTAAFFCPLDTAGPSFLLGTVGQTLYALAEWYVADSLLKKDHLILQPGMRTFSYGDAARELFPLELRLIAIRDGIYHEFRHRWQEPPGLELAMQFVSLQEVAGPYSRQTFGLKLPVKEKAEVLVSIFNKSTDRFQPNSFLYQPARAPYMPIPYVRHYFMQTTTGFAGSTKGPVMYRAASRDMVAGSDMAAREETAVGQTDGNQENSLSKTLSPEPQEQEPVIRSDFEETLAFLPHLVPDSTGYVPVSFQTNGLLSTFRLLALAHTTDGKSTWAEETITVRKEVMALPYFPAYVRSGDRVSLTCRVVNLTSDTLQGAAYLTVDDNETVFRPVTLLPSAHMLFRQDYQMPGPEALRVPLVTLKAGFESPSHSDAETHTIPVLSMLEQVTRAQTKTVQGNSVLTLLQKDKSSQAHLEVSTPLTASLKALPVLCQPESNNLTSWLAAYYANNTGAMLLERFPYILDTLRADARGQVSVFEQNSRIGALLLEETPWSSYPGQEAERIQRLLALADRAYVSSFNAKALEHFRALQRQDGGFSWFPGMESSYLLTLHFLEKIGDMIEKDVLAYDSGPLPAIVSKAVRYADSLFLKNTGVEELRDLGSEVKLYFYVRSAFTQIPYGQEIAGIATRLARDPLKAWEGASVMEKAYLAVTLERWGETRGLAPLLASLREFAVCESESGCYFPNAILYESPMSSRMKAHALLLRVFRADPILREGITRWILDRKQNNIWTSRARTTDVIHALLHYGGPVTHSPAQYEIRHRGTTYTVRNRSDALLYVSLYEQTTEDLSAAPAYANGLEITRTWHRTTDNSPIGEGDTLRTGERIVARYLLGNDKERSFVHLKASRASCLMPVTETSGHHGNRTCSWFREVKQASTQYFFQNLPAGLHVIEEPFYVIREGTFNQGSVKAQSLYAPQYGGFSAGGKLLVKE